MRRGFHLALGPDRYPTGAGFESGRESTGPALLHCKRSETLRRVFTTTTFPFSALGPWLALVYRRTNVTFSQRLPRSAKIFKCNIAIPFSTKISTAGALFLPLQKRGFLRRRAPVQTKRWPRLAKTPTNPPWSEDVTLKGNFPPKTTAGGIPIWALGILPVFRKGRKTRGAWL